MPLQEAWGTFILAFVIFGITNGGNKVLGAFGSEIFRTSKKMMSALENGWNSQQGPKVWGETTLVLGMFFHLSKKWQLKEI